MMIILVYTKVSYFFILQYKSGKLLIYFALYPNSIILINFTTSKIDIIHVYVDEWLNIIFNKIIIIS